MLPPPERASGALGDREEVPSRSPSAARRPGTALPAFAALAAALAVAPARGDVPLPVRDEPALDRWGEAQGLPFAVHALAQADDGALWIGAGRGLVRFDGTAFSRVRLEGLAPDAAVRCLLEAAPGELWACTDRGLGRIRGGRLEVVEGSPGDLTALHLAADGTLWVGTQRGVGRVRAGRYEPIPGEHPSVYAVGADAGGRVLAGGEAGLFQVRDGHLARWPAAAGGVDGRVGALLTDRRGRTWAGTADGLRRLGAPGAVAGLTALAVTALAEGPDGAVWVATINGSVHRLSGDGRAAGPREAERLGRPVHAMLVDADGSAWLGSGAGLARLRQRLLLSVTHDHGLSGEVVWSVYADPRDGSILAGIDGAGLDRIGPRGPEPLGARWGLLGSTVTAALRAGDGVLWLATGPAGLWRVVGDRAAPVPPVGAARTRVRGLAQALDGAVLVGTETGIERHVAGRATAHEVPRAAPVRVIVDTGRGAIWAGGSGLALLEGPGLQDRTPAGLSKARSIMAVVPEGDDLWLGSYADGLQLWHGGRLTTFGELDPRFAQGVVAVLPEGDDRLWIAQEGSLVMARRSELRARAEGRAVPLRVLAFDDRDGLPSTEFTSAGQSPAAATPDGRLWFGTVNGVVVVDPRRLAQLRPPAPPQVERAFLDGAEVALDGGPVRVDHADATLELHLSSPTLQAPHRLLFRHRLAQDGEPWRLAGPSRAAFYRGLREGAHRVEVEVSRDGIDWVAARAPLRVEVRPGPLERAWVRALLGALAAGVVLGGAVAVQGLRGRRLRAQAEELARLVAARTQELAAARDGLERRVEERTAQLQRELAERERLERQLADAQRLDSIGRLAGGVAHDLNNLLTVVLGCASTAQDPEATPASMREDLGEIQRAGERAAALTRQLLAFARRQILASRRLDLNDVVSGVVTLLRRAAGPHVELVLEVSAEPCPVLADPGQLEQVLVNLAVNARDAMPTGGTLRVETTPVRLEQDHGGARPGVAAGDWVRLRVRDTGTGLSAEAERHLFEPFFTTKEKGRGTGLGLATCYGIVKQMGGHIWLHSAPGQGTTVEIHLPRSEGPVERGAGEPGAAARAGGGELVLVAEDEPQVRALAARALTDRGFRVVAAADGEAALREFDRLGGAVDLVLTDVIMPRLGGVALAALVAGRAPRVPVLFMSGYVDPVERGQDALPDGAEVLVKPFTPAALAGKVREVLDRARG